MLYSADMVVGSVTRRLLFAGLVTLALGAMSSSTAPVVLAAASLQESLNAAADAWVRAGHPRPILAFAASSTLARQIEAGAPADLFVSADEEWMDGLARKKLVVAGTRADMVGNTLVVIEPLGRTTRIPMAGAKLARMLGAGPLAIADPDSVPAGKYAKAALVRLGAWRDVVSHLVRAENVRAALAFVERGAARFGIVYLTDAKASTKVRVAGVFPAASHPAIRYPLARLVSSTNPEAEGFRRFLLSPPARASFARFGFTVPGR